MELDEASLAIGRIERALSRIEKSLSEQASARADLDGRPGNPVGSESDTALRAEVAAVIGELDALIAEAKRG